MIKLWLMRSLTNLQTLKYSIWDQWDAIHWSTQETNIHNLLIVHREYLELTNMCFFFFSQWGLENHAYTFFGMLSNIEWIIKKKFPSSTHLVKKFWVLYSCDDPIWSHTLGKLPLESAKTKKTRWCLNNYNIILLILGINSR